jgi:hypothetical protein
MIKSLFVYIDMENGSGSFVMSGVDQQSLQEMRTVESMAKTVAEQLGRTCVELEVQQRVKTLMEEVNEQRDSEQVS